jgi:eukaryotic-like serine/threonine-protein kinase
MAVEDRSDEARPPTPHQHLPAGTLLQNGRYLVESLIGQGGMGAVYLVRDTHFFGPRPVPRALKEMVPRFSDLHANRERFKHEANILVTLKHSGIPAVHDSFTEFHRAYIVLDYVEGHDLQAVVRQRAEMLPPEEVTGWMIQLCDIVHYLHTRQPPVIFRDLKPSNVILSPDGEIVLIDFGIAKIFEPDDRQTGIGTAGYAAPEQYRGKAETRSDIYSPGAMMHHLLTRTDPRQCALFSFAERVPRDFNPAISPALEAVVMRCLREPLAERFQTVSELRAALQMALSAESQFNPLEAGRTTSAQNGSVAVSGPPAPRVRWRFRTQDEVRSTPVTDGNLLFVGSYDGRLYALDIGRGERVWQYMTEGGICGTPALWEDLIIFGSEDFTVYALGRREGAEAWCHRTLKQVRSSPRVFDGRLFVGSDDGHCYALDPRRGQLLWKYRALREVRTSPAYADGLVFFGTSDEYLYALDAETGERKWAYHANGQILSSPAVAEGHVYFGSLDFFVYCLQAKLGWVTWSERTDRFIVSSPCVAGDRLFIGSTDGNLYCLHRRTGQRLWRFTAGTHVNGTPVHSDGLVYFGGVDGILYCLDASSGKLRWRFQTEGKITGAPCVFDGRVYMGSTDGWVYAIEPPE